MLVTDISLVNLCEIVSAEELEPMFQLLSCLGEVAMKHRGILLPEGGMGAWPVDRVCSRLGSPDSRPPLVARL